MATSNSFVTPTWVVKEVARLAINNIKFAKNVKRAYSDDFKAGGAKVGASFNLRLPQRFQTTKGQAFQQQAISDQIVPMVITDQANIGISWSTFDATFSVEEVRDRYLRPSAVQLANTVDFDGLTRMTPKVYHAVGTPGTTPTNIQTYLDAVTKLRNVAVPDSNLVAVVSPNMSATLVGNNATLFNPAGLISENFEEGQFSDGRQGLGIKKWFWDQNTVSRTTGTFTSSTPLVNVSGGVTAQGTTSIVTDGWASGASSLNIGDKFTMALVYEINPQNFASTGQLMQFTVTANVTDSAGAMTINFSPPMNTIGAGPTLANVSALPADNAAIIPLGSTITTGAGTMAATVTKEGLVYDPEAFVLGIVDPDSELPGADVAPLSDNQTGWAMRYARQYNAQTDQKISRIDMFYGWLAFRPDWACLVEGGAS
jgi:hypothetical protein